MSVASCPRCQDEVRVPANLPDSALVRCPLCTEEFELAEVGLPPLLEVVDGALVGAAVGESHAAEGDADGFSLSPEEPSGVPAFSLGDSSAPAADATAKPSPMRRRAPAKSKSSPIRQVVNIVGGGVIGLALGQLALWYLPGDWAKQQRDPFGLGPKVAQYAPWLVPEQVSGTPLTDNDTDADDGEVNAAQGGNRNPQANGGGNLGSQVAQASPDEMDLNNIGMNAAQGDPNGSTDVPGTGGDPTFTPPPFDDDPLGTGGETPGTGGDPLGTGGETPGTGGDPLSIGGDPAIPTPTIDDPLAIDNPLDVLGTPDPTEDPNVETLVTSIAAASGAALTLNNEFGQMSPDERRKVGQDLYDALADAGNAIQELGSDHRQVRNRSGDLQQVLKEAVPGGNTSKVLSYIGRTALEAKTADPLLVMGTVETVGKDGDTPIVRLKVNDQHAVLVVAPKSHDGSYAAGDQVYVLGRRLAEDEHSWEGEQHVVRSSMIVKP